MWEAITMRISKRIEAHEKGYRQNIGLMGREGSGKSRFLIRLEQLLIAKPHLVVIGVHCPALDLDQFMERWMGAILSGLFLSQSIQGPKNFQSLLAASEPIVPKTVERMKSLKKMSRKEKPSVVLRELFSLTDLLSQETGKKIILMLDEFQELEKLPCLDPFALLGKQIMVEKNTLYIVTSSKPEKAREIFRDKLSLLFGNFEIMETACLEFEQAYAFMDREFGDLHLTSTDKQFLMRMTDGWLVYLDLLLDRARMLRASDFETAEAPSLLLKAFSHELFDGSGRIYGLFQRKLDRLSLLSREQMLPYKILLAIASGKRKVQTIAVFVGTTSKEVKKFLQRLTIESLLFKRGSFYSLEDPLFRFWLREVWAEKRHLYGFNESALHEHLAGALQGIYEASRKEDFSDATLKVEALLKEFRNDVVEVNEKKMKCPQFVEVASRPTNGRFFPVYARSHGIKWVCQVAGEPVREEHVGLFMDELKWLRNVQRRILITLNGMDENSRLLAQEEKIQIWGLRDFNALLDLYDLPKIIPLTREKELKDGSIVGALAPSLHSA